MRPAAPGETVFRLLEGPEPTADQFLSDEADGRSQNLARTQSLAIHRGFSTRRTLGQAITLARTLEKPYVAEIVLTWEEGDAIARTLSTNGHHTVWADPASISNRVRNVYEV